VALSLNLVEIFITTSLLSLADVERHLSTHGGMKGTSPLRKETKAIAKEAAKEGKKPRPSRDFWVEMRSL
jgi:hypothetical protein